MSKLTTSDRATNMLATEAGRRICSELRAETWYQLMSASSDPMHRRLGASIFLASAFISLRQIKEQNQRVHIRQVPCA